MPLPSHATAAADMGRRALLSAAPVLLALPVMLAGRPHDPVFRAIEAARDARDAFTEALGAVDAAERDKAALRAADEAADRDTEARTVLARTRPVTREGLHALIRHHAEDIGFLEPDTFGALALREIADALPPPAPAAPPTHRSQATRLALIAAETAFAAIVCGGAALSQIPHLI